ncbi:MAG: hypothetical protein A2Y03_03725 [Omnitrophica WOR_2 bacterium GWF2_38_59]|nr:MAG: hypothetical protein A2Y06_04705 [Omnitrophica WOR_2 bacterium GWA2_37_7]OGX24332.1 MAG: hypothetical protein A2Y03_03725 [Omnitrophica WOR_2 bacterium GWF2_38_59]OGX47145.1 MAG: hypothetical protein A2243_04850 [Omnitrophica WOR_2 bacterium RIFOXYA2_FULL_38_17]OGX54899.1 MAG: hypothetical protein A2267_01370 [Omnitrophica WOR_2 bacterium RIFOXYA12_FULL_38_10]OGX57037.1 MAG: hypothetical protein A2447_02685 [Omnitrophica WOR_2 bacterium RIFOXYC2_FULL_38_12]OGX57129.1 MAG: hypothetical 
MDQDKINKLKKDIIAIGRLLWDKELASGLNGNISVRVDKETILLTATKTCLGLLKEEDILLMNVNGDLIDEGAVSTENTLHTEIYRNFDETQTIVHTHTTYVNGYFLVNDKFNSGILETKLFLGEVRSIKQSTPAVTEFAPVIDELKGNNIIVLKNHGVLAMGRDLFDCFLLIQGLENAIRVDAVARLYKSGLTNNIEIKDKKEPKPEKKNSDKYDLFSKEQIDAIVKLVNEDPQMSVLGDKTDMTMELAVKLAETGKVFSFNFKKGKIVNVSSNENAEFLITATESIWRAVFTSQIDPFVATTQKKMNLRGDFARISKWYAPCSRVFELWTGVPIE